MLFHGYGGSKFGLGSGGGGIGSAISSMTPGKGRLRGLQHVRPRLRRVVRHGGQPRSVPAQACANGFNHLLDTRYEVRDAQFFAGQLADEGLVSRKRIAAMGGSYGGGMSMALAALKNRVMRSNGRLAPWRSPAGKKMSLAAATPLSPVDRSGLLAHAQRAHARLRRGRSVPRALRGDEVFLREHALRGGLWHPEDLCTTTSPNWTLGSWRDRLV